MGNSRVHLVFGHGSRSGNPTLRLQTTNNEETMRSTGGLRKTKTHAHRVPRTVRMQDLREVRRDGTLLLRPGRIRRSRERCLRRAGTVGTLSRRPLLTPSDFACDWILRTGSDRGGRRFH